MLTIRTQVVDEHDNECMAATFKRDDLAVNDYGEREFRYFEPNGWTIIVRPPQIDEKDS